MNNEPKKLSPVMFAGTGSDVGKSVINAAFCRIFKQDHYQPAPFKAQNMSLNSFATIKGGEIGRAQAVQAEACGIECSTDMNPVLLKPSGDSVSQVVVNGKPIGHQSAWDYFNETDRDQLFEWAIQGYERLSSVYNPIVIEGAGSISEVNLWKKDITNMRVARRLHAPTILVADIDKGGVFASVYGSIQLLPPEERDLIKGILINKFRGDPNLFREGKDTLERLTGKPVIGIIPYFKDIYIEQEDAVVIQNRTGSALTNKINIAVILLRHISNFTDFNQLEHIPGVHLYYTLAPGEIEKADIILIPGSKNTISDMQHLRNTGVAGVIIDMHKKGKQVYGICGGYQIMGQEIRDPDHVESDIEVMPGLGILPVSTTLQTAKTTEQCTFTFLDHPEPCKGYEIHMGTTTPLSGDQQPVCVLENGVEDGYYLDATAWGTYIHGIFDNRNIVESILEQTGKSAETNVSMDYAAMKEQQYDRLAAWVRQNTDMETFYKILEQT